MSVVQLVPKATTDANAIADWLVEQAEAFRTGAIAPDRLLMVYEVPEGVAVMCSDADVAEPHLIGLLEMAKFSVMGGDE